MHRLAEERLKFWLSGSRNALLIEGARQVGKTYLVHQFIQERKVPSLELNFLLQKDYLNALKRATSIKDMVRLFSLFSSEQLIKGESIIFLDEIQEYPEIITLIKGLVDEGSFRYILSGSLLGLTLKQVSSYPVGYLDRFTLYPMTFYEFVIANRVKEENLQYLKDCFEKGIPVEPLIHDKMMELFRYYLVTGGMPNVVASYLADNTLIKMESIQQSIMDSYKVDFTKYEKQEKRLKILEIYNNIPSQLGKQDTRFVFSYLQKGLKFDRYEESFNWLKDSKTTIPVYVVDHIQSPFIVSRSTNVFKLFYNDVGLFTSTYSFKAKESLLNPDNSLSNGSLYENFVAEELLGNGLKPFYYKSNKIGEVDFVIEIDGKILPIEVKSGKDFKKHPALDKFIEEKEFKVTEGYVLSNNNIAKEGKITYLPIYMTMFIKEPKPKDVFLKRIEGL